MTSPTPAAIPHPLPAVYLTTQPGIGGTLKQRVDDFLVDEVPAYDPVGEGEHIYLGIEKHGVSHAEMIAVIARQFGVPREKIGFAGMKDKQAITRQTVSLHLHKDPPRLELDHERMKVLWVRRHRNRLRRGHLKGNRFSIRIRDVDPIKAVSARAVLRELERAGVPNFYGQQRFGYRCNTHRLGLALLRGQWEELLAELLGTTGSPFPEHQRERRELFEQGKFREALAQWSVADRAESSVLHKLSQGFPPREACKRLDRSVKSFWVSAVQSAMFNRVLEKRLATGTLGSLVQGDLAYKHDKGSVFRITPEELQTGELDARLASLEISPSGPVWGQGMTRAGGGVDETESEALSAFGVELENIPAREASLEGARRPLRVPLKLPVIDAGVDEHGGYIRLAFELPPGSYATVVAREIMKNAQDENDPE